MIFGPRKPLFQLHSRIIVYIEEYPYVFFSFCHFTKQTYMLLKSIFKYLCLGCVSPRLIRCGRGASGAT